MRRPCWTLLAFSVALQVFTPAPAHAWWEYIEGLSGPKLHGPHFEWRMLCFMEKRRQEDKDLLERYRPKSQGESAPSEEEKRENKLLHAVYGLKSPCIWKIHKNVEHRRLWSLDVGYRYHWDKSFGPANGHKVKFNALTPVFTWYPESRPTRDVVDLSAGVGVYRFSSDAFDTFYGYFYDLRADVHMPTVIRRLSKWTVLIPAGRVGLLTFPAGFKENRFADAKAGLRSKAMDKYERVAYLGFFFDLDALVK